MIIEGKVIDMARFLGRGIQIYLKDGSDVCFKPTEFVRIEGNDDLGYWYGYDDEGIRRSVARYEIESIKVVTT